MDDDSRPSGSFDYPLPRFKLSANRRVIGVIIRPGNGWIRVRHPTQRLIPSFKIQSVSILGQTRDVRWR